jgi:hypothetical protein
MQQAICAGEPAGTDHEVRLCLVYPGGRRLLLDDADVVCELPVGNDCVVMAKNVVDVCDAAATLVLLLVLLAGLLAVWAAAIAAVQVSLRA